MSSNFSTNTASQCLVGVRGSKKINLLILLFIMKPIQKAVVKKDNKFLIILRSPNAKFFPEHWDFPGGKLEPGEEPFAGIEREVMEETNLKVKAINALGIYELESDYQGEKFCIHLPYIQRKFYLVI